MSKPTSAELIAAVREDGHIVSCPLCVRLADALEAADRRIESLTAPVSEDFDTEAELFLLATGYMRPGKDERESSHSLDERQGAWAAWVALRRRIAELGAEGGVPVCWKCVDPNCSICDGTGQIKARSVVSSSETCPSCRGYRSQAEHLDVGRLRLHIKERCSLCNGTGRVGVGEGQEMSSATALADALEAAEKRVAELEASLPDPYRLNLLADWIDVKEADDPTKGTGVQCDLRRWARLIENAMGKKR